MEPQNINLTTFLIGVVLYAIFYIYLDKFDSEHTFLKYSIYILIADAFAMIILYKNLKKNKIIKEDKKIIKEKYETPGPKMRATNNKSYIVNKVKSEFPKLNYVATNEPDNMEGFVKDSALGDSYNTNGNSNNYNY